MMVAMNPETWDDDIRQIEPAATCCTIRPADAQSSSATTSS